MRLPSLNTSDIPSKVKNKELVEKRREQIVVAAGKLFAQKGFHKTTLRDLTEEAGISYGNIYDYVSCKEDIFFLLYQYMVDISDYTISQAMENIADPVEKLRRMVRAEFNLMYQWSDSILQIYQESHVLKQTLLKKLLQRERKRTEMFERVLQECAEKKKCRSENYRTIANLIRCMLDSWILKRWDLREYISQFEMEKSILNLLFYGLLEDSEKKIPKNTETLKGKTGILINADNSLGKALSYFLLSRELDLVVYKNSSSDDELESHMKETGHVKAYSFESHGRMTPELFKQINNDSGPIDIVIHNMSIVDIESKKQTIKPASGGAMYDENLHCAQELAMFFATDMVSSPTLKRILYLAPWAWNRDINPLRYQTVKSATVALTEALANTLAPSRINVNCIIPGFIGSIRPTRLEADEAQGLADKIPMGYFGEIPDIADALYFLISDASKYVTGQVLQVSGGLN